MAGGGQCWDYDSCFVREDATVGPFGPAEFAKESKRFQGVLSIGDTESPFRDWNIVFIPYCTGDFHGGDSVATYSDPNGKKRSFSHVGRRNVIADVARLRGLFPSPSRLVVGGISAGGYGAVLNYSTFREGWPAGATYLVDDSGPFLPVISASDRTAMYTNWGLDHVLEPICGTACRDDLSLAPARVAARYPKDRMALVSSRRDHDISDTFHIAPDQFETALVATSAQLDATGNFRTFLIGGNSHMTLNEPAKFSANGVPLTTWLTQLVNGDAAWSSVRSP